MARARKRGVLVRSRDPGARRRSVVRAFNALVLASVLSAAGWGVHTLLDPQRFPLRRVQIAGTLEHVDRGALTAALGAVSHGGFFSVDVARMGAAARAVPWVDDAQVRRAWPDTLVVTITEQQAVARWASGALVNTRGELFEVPAPAPDDLPLLAGPPGTAGAVLERYRQFATVLEGVGELRAAAQDARGTWRLTLADGVEITLGGRGAAASLERFARIYTTRLAGRVPPLASVDLRYADGFAVRHRARAEPATPPPASMARL